MPHTVRLARVRTVGLWAAGLLYAAWAVGQLARDATWLTGLCYYIPSPVVAAVWLPLAGVMAAFRFGRWMVAIVLCVPPVVGVEYSFAPRSEGGPRDFRLVHWNTGGRPGRDGGRELLVPLRADLYAFTDCPSFGQAEVLRRASPDADLYQSVAFGGLAVVGRGAVRADGWLVDRDGFLVQAVTWTYADREVKLFVIDLPSDLRVSRGPLLAELNALIARHRPDLVVGDFNAPRRSWGLSRLPAGYTHAYDRVGRGWGYSWPVPVPVYALDHCLIGPRVRPAHYELGGMSGDSDHRYQVFDFSLKAD